MVTVEEAWKALLMKNEEIKEAVESLKKAIKDERTQHIQECIQSEDFTSATGILDHLNIFTKVRYRSNLNDIEKALHTVMNKTYESAPTEEPLAKSTPAVFVPEPVAQVEVNETIANDELTTEEEDTIRIIGYSGISRLKDGNKVQEQTVQNLIAKGLLVHGETKNTLSFELSNEGREQFERMEGIEANPSFIREMELRMGDVEQGYFNYDLENTLQEKGFKIEMFDGNNLDISRDNYYYYLTVDNGTLTKAEYFEILEEKNRLKSIGFICINEEVLAQGKSFVDEWVTANKTKCRFMSIHYGTCEQMEQAEAMQEFEVITL